MMILPRPFALWTCVLAFSIGLPQASHSEPATTDESANEETLARILEGARKFERSYIGSFSRREIITRSLAGGNGELRRTRKAVVDVWDYHGEHPTNQVLECTLDGKPVDLEKCVDPQRIEPAYRLFAKDADLHYRFRYQALDSWRGTASHKIRIVPLQKTSRHLEGDIFFRVDTLQILGMRITLADYPFGLKDLSIELTFEDHDGRAVIASGESSATLYVPLLINERAHTVFTASQQRLLTEDVSLAASATGG